MRQRERGGGRMKELGGEKKERKKEKRRTRVTKVKRKFWLDTNIDRGINKIEISKFIDQS